MSDIANVMENMLTKYKRELIKVSRINSDHLFLAFKGNWVEEKMSNQSDIVACITQWLYLNLMGDEAKEYQKVLTKFGALLFEF